jgi:hypothetical protein
MEELEEPKNAPGVRASVSEGDVELPSPRGRASAGRGGITFHGRQDDDPLVGRPDAAVA